MFWQGINSSIIVTQGISIWHQVQGTGFFSPSLPSVLGALALPAKLRRHTVGCKGSHRPPLGWQRG